MMRFKTVSKKGNRVIKELYKDNLKVGFIDYKEKGKKKKLFIELNRIHVENGFRNCGYGKYMMQYLQAKELPVTLSVLYDQVIGFYEKLHFIRDSETDFTYLPKEVSSEYRCKILNKFKHDKLTKEKKEALQEYTNEMIDAYNDGMSLQ